MKNIIISLVVVTVVILGGILLFRSGGDDQFINNNIDKDFSDITQADQSEDPEKLDNKNFDKAPDFIFKDYDGNEVSLSQFDGKAKIINSWAVWCPFCRQELTDFAEIQKEFGEDIVVIAIDRKESLEKAKGFTDSLDVEDNIIFLLDPKDDFYTSIGGFSMPETLFVDAENNIITHKRGFMDLKEMREKTQSLLENNLES